MAKEEYDFQIIANLMAGKGEARERLKELEGFLKSNHQTFRSLSIVKPTPISQIPDDGRTKIKKAVICIGGDGTVSETVGYVLNNKIDAPVALIPTGTANIIAATLGLGLKKGNFGFLLKEKTKQIDIGVLEYQDEKDYLLLGFGLGFEENFLRLTKEKFKSNLGIFSYIFAALGELLSLKKIPLKICYDGVTVRTNLCLLTVLNLKPKILKIFPLFKDDRIRIDDQILNVYFVKYHHFLQAFFGTLVFHLLGKYNFGLVKTISGKEFLLESSVPVGTQVDGELRSSLPVKIYFYPQPGVFIVP